MSGTQNLQAVLKELELRRDCCQEELQAVEQAMSGIKALLARDASLLVHIPQGSYAAATATTSATIQKYSGMSVRWGVLQYLAEDVLEPASTAEIANALIDGGMTTKGRDFISNVSAVISVMVNKRGELESTDGKYSLTDNGRAAWNAIKLTNQYRSRSLNFTTNVQ
jgi:hypothetical protein